MSDTPTHTHAESNGVMHTFGHTQAQKYVDSRADKL
jgi:hypothetical protein